MSKCCPRCKQVKEAEAFHANKRNKNGLSDRCKQCQHEVYVASRDLPMVCRLCGKDIAFEHQRPDPRTRDGVSRICLPCLEARRESAKPRIRAARRVWGRTEKGKEASRHTSNRYWARKAKAEGTFSRQEWCEVLEDFNHHCAYCHEPLVGTPHQEHMQALINGGRDDRSNIVPACKTCNSRKQNMSLIFFLTDAQKTNPTVSGS